jgi:hypothetical protein
VQLAGALVRKYAAELSDLPSVPDAHIISFCDKWAHAAQIPLHDIQALLQLPPFTRRGLTRLPSDMVGGGGGGGSVVGAASSSSWPSSSIAAGASATAGATGAALPTEL